jgi:ABC-type Mn2+/Zn2+ transport system permease subunit
MTNNMIYIVLAGVFVIVIAYFCYQVKIKNNQNYPAVFAMGLAFLVILGNGSSDWIIKNINHYLGLSLEAPKQLSIYEISIFFLLLYGLTALYYKYKFGKVIQKNSIFSFFIKGNIEQKNESKK